MKTTIFLACCSVALLSGVLAKESQTAPIPPYQWSLYTPEYLNKLLEQNLLAAQQKVETISQLPHDKVNFQNSFLALEEASFSLDETWSVIMGHLSAIDNNQNIRDMKSQWTERVSSFFSSIALNQKLYHVLKSCPVKDSLTIVEKRFIKVTLQAFEDQGILLSDAKRKRCMEIQSRLAQCTQEFGNKVLDAQKKAAYIVSDESELMGLPAFAIEAAKNEALSMGLATETSPAWRFGNNPMLTSLAMQRGDSAKLREGVWRKNRSIAEPGEYDTEPLINEILSLRQELATLLGSQHFTDLMTKRRMAKSGAKVDAFLGELMAEVKPLRDQLMKNVLAFHKKETMHSWDVNYYIEKMNQEKYAFDSESLRPYFEKEHVLKSVFSICSQLFDIDIKLVKSVYKPLGSTKILLPGEVEVAHPEIQYYQVYDRRKKEYLGGFYLDLFPREAKADGACLMPMASKMNHKVATVLANLSRPNADEATLLSLNDVTILFHEFGHLLHFMLSDIPINSLAGTSVAWDFVELPSQWLENTLYSPEVLAFVGKHYKTGQPIPDEAIGKMLMLKKLNTPFRLLSSLKLSLLDSTLHSHNELVKEKGIDALDAELTKSLQPEGVIYTETPATARSFGHIFEGGYAGAYYSYLWAEALDADVTERFQKEGVLNPILGELFRHTILSQGNADDADILYKNFMGREASLEPLLRRNGKEIKP